MCEALVEVRNLHFRYPDGQEALRGINFQMRAGETIGLLGPNGAGKSTLLLHLNGVLPQPPRRDTSGVEGVRIGGLLVHAATLPQIRQQVGLVFQDPNDQLFCPTVLEDVAFGPRNFGKSREEAIRLAEESLRMVGMEEHRHRVPSRLSLGEQKRVCVAGVLASQPRLLALDEPTSHLDPRARRSFLEMLRGLNVAKLIATHDLELVVELCDRVLILDRGQIQGDGAPRDLLSQAPLMERHGLEVPLSLRLGLRG